MIDEQKMDEIMLTLGHTDFNRGTAFLRDGVKLYDGGMRRMTKEIYPTIAKIHGSTPSRVERCMRHSIERAWERGSYQGQTTWFGYTVNPEKGTPTVGEYLARMARICHED